MGLIFYIILFMEKIFKKILFFYLPLMAWIGGIFYLSSIPGLRSGVESFPLEVFFRKSAHIFEYMILAFLFFRFFYFAKHFSLEKSKKWSMVFVAICAFLDETIQFFVENRAGRLIDVGIDVLAGLFMLFLLSSFYSKNKKARKKNLFGAFLTFFILALIISIMMYLVSL